MAKPDGGPAFPVVVTSVPGGHVVESFDNTAPGMSLRDYFAAHAPCLDTRPSMVSGPEGSAAVMRQIAEECYQFADAMIAERSK